MSRWALILLFIAAPVWAQERGGGGGGDSNNIPPNHRPPPGMCRIWIDGVPAGRQPAPTDCATAIRRRPPNARVIFGDELQSTPRIRADRNDRPPVVQRSSPSVTTATPTPPSNDRPPVVDRGPDRPPPPHVDSNRGGTGGASAPPKVVEPQHRPVMPPRIRMPRLPPRPVKPHRPGF